MERLSAVVARAVKHRRDARATAIARGREQEALRRVGEERLRIARDLHDVVAHGITVINVQAATALHLMDRRPERAKLALETINDVSKQSLAELRSVLGVLREDAYRPPAPTLRRLDELIARAAEAGLTVRATERGPRVDLPVEADRAAYRIVQEALTNVARHSRGATAWVRIDYAADAVRVQVDDDGRAPAGRTVRYGNGLVGMRERAEALGGTMSVQPRPAGGLRVSAVLPIRGRR